MSEPCVLCAHAEEHGSWPSSHQGTHCECHRSWSGGAECHCASCHEHFSSASVFDSHLPHCGKDMSAVASKNGLPLFELRNRLDGPIWIRFNSEERSFDSQKVA